MLNSAVRSIGELSQQGALEFGDGYRTKRSEHAASGYRIIRVADVNGGAIQLDGPDFVSQGFAHSIGGKAGLAGDILLTTKGTVGRVAIVPELHESIVYSPQLCYFRVRDTDLIDPRYLSFWFRSDEFLRQASHRMNNTDMAAYINLADIRSLTLRLPNLDEQRGIAEVLGALDDKIAANSELAKTADGLSQVVFRSIAGSASSAPLSTTARFVNGKAFTKGASGTGRVVIRIAELNSGLGVSTVFSDAEVGDDFLARPGDILFAWSGSLTLHRWFRTEAIVNQHIFKVIPNGYPSWLIYELLRDRLPYFQGIAADKATTMGHIQRRHLDELVDVPSSSSIDRVDELMTSLWDRTLLAERENETLAATRHALLPQLMSGALQVRDAESSLEGVV